MEVTCTEPHHATELLHLMCGTDEAARLMAGLPPAMRLALVSTEALQSNCMSQSQSLGNGMALALPLPDGSMDAVLTVHVGCHLTDWRPMLLEFWRVLKPGGIVLMCEPVNAGAADLALWQSLGIHLRTPADMVAAFSDCCFRMDYVHEAQWMGQVSDLPEPPPLSRGAASVVMRLARQDLRGQGH